MLAKVQSVPGARDVLIAEYDERLDPSVIESIKTWHQEAGYLKATLLDILKSASPRWLALKLIILDEAFNGRDPASSLALKPGPTLMS